MKLPLKLRTIVGISSLIAFGMGATVAHAQGYAASAGAVAQKPGSNKYFGSVSAFPLANFSIAGTFSGGTSGTSALFGGLIALEGGILDRGPGDNGKVRSIYQIGGWYWGRSGNDLYEIHARVQSPKGLGLQIGYLNTTSRFVQKFNLTDSIDTDAEAYDVFLIYRLSSDSVRSQNGRQWSVEFGLGSFIDASRHRNATNAGATPTYSNGATANYTFYFSGAYQFAPKWWLTASDWVLRDRFQDLNRITVGVSFTSF